MTELKIEPPASSEKYWSDKWAAEVTANELIRKDHDQMRFALDDANEELSHLKQFISFKKIDDEYSSFMAGD